MAEKVGLFGQMLWGQWAERSAINRNAASLETVEGRVADLRDTIEKQNDEIVRLRAMIVGLAEVVKGVAPFDSADLERAVKDAYLQLVPPPAVTSTDPYRGTPASLPEDSPVAQELLAQAQKLHYSKQFKEAKAVYEQIVAQHGATKQAATAKTQLANLRSV